jgi:hypothetical protein
MAWHNPSWTYRKKFTIDAAQVDADLTDFPVYVSLKDADILAAARADMRDVLFTAADGSTKLSHELVKRSRVGIGAWTWYNDPRAIYHNGKTYIGAIDGSGNLYVGQYTHSSGALAWNTLTATLEADDHDNPALIVRPSDSKLVAFYSKHNALGDTTLRYKISTNAEDASAWGTEQTIDYGSRVSYANPVILEDDSNACYVINRVLSGASPWYYARTTDYSTWGTPVKFWDPTTADASSYVKLAKNGSGRIDFFATNTHPVLGATSLYHFYCAWDSGSSALKWYNSAGTEQTLPMTEAKATLIYDGTTNSGWNHQIAIDGDGNPRVLFQKTVSTSPYDHRLMFSRWNGSAWTAPVEILTLGPGVYNPENYYTGNSCFDGNDVSKIYVGVYVSSTWEMQEWTTADNGATWSKSRDITTGSASTLLNRNPYSPIGHDGHFACLWCSGSYGSFTSFNMDIHCDPPIAHEAHVKVPSISGTTDTDIYCYYGNAAATAQEAADLSDVWSGFEVVYHMEPQPASLNIIDSSGNGHHGTKKGWREPNISETGFVVGNLSGHKYDRIDDHISTPSGLNMAGWSEVTVESIINHNGQGSAGQEHPVFSNFGSTQGGVICRIKPSSDASANQLEVFSRNTGDTQKGGVTGGTVTPNQTNHVALVMDLTSIRGVINGTQAPNTFATGVPLDADASIQGKIGGYDATPTDRFGGYQEEFRISNVARSTAWLKSTYVNLLTPATFYTLGTQEILTPAGSSAGSSTVSGVGASTNTQAGSSSGLATVSGVGASIHSFAGASAGSSVVSGVGASIHEASGSSAGTATVSGIGDSTTAGGATGSSAGTATVAGVGVAIVSVVGSASGSSTVAGISPSVESSDDGGGGIDPYWVPPKRQRVKKRIRKRINALDRQLTEFLERHSIPETTERTIRERARQEAAKSGPIEAIHVTIKSPEPPIGFDPDFYQRAAERLYLMELELMLIEEEQAAALLLLAA